ncbi:hypothetical protein JQN72_06935 [Phycicoccus sp. CSK15P-2]|uniref:hypothetical protein n=1 Tax=Phycicoccus sp. CSK15P-2 TaxID=2807627 RepID=UPI00194E64E2|nr:hypothetical protein [Phycicoccus sp. CSK15P-2]MBM6403975.1 hypothetical protein [Phycicoccus sp. CSK15P-2]
MERASGAGRGAVVPDVRGEGRALRVTWHPEADVVVLSVWRENVCVATTRVAPADVPALVEVLVGGLADASGARVEQRTAG